MKYYHGTTAERLRSIRSRGLPVGSFVTPDLAVAKFFAKSRSEWNGMPGVILVVELNKRQVTPTTLDRSGRQEATTKVITFPKELR